MLITGICEVISQFDVHCFSTKADVTIFLKQICILPFLERWPFGGDVCDNHWLSEDNVNWHFLESPVESSTQYMNNEIL